MKKVYYVMAIDSPKELQHYKEYHKISDNPEDRTLCIYRERWQEIEYFTKTGNCLFFDGTYLHTPDFQRYNIQTQDILCPRMSVPEASKFLRWFPCVSTPDTYQAIEHWFKTVPTKFSKRCLITATQDDVQANFKSYVDKVIDATNRFFIKSVKKHWSYAGSLEGWHSSGASLSLGLGSGSALCLLSPFVTIKEDNLPPVYQEYRCFYFFGKLCSISRYCDYEVHHIPEHILQEAQIYEKEIIGKSLPETIVIDIADTEELGPIFLEANDVTSSGRYILNTVESFPLVKA